MSQGKTTHPEFLDSNSLPLDEIMKSDSNGLSKEERSIQDLAHYLSCPTPPTSHKDNMMIDDKGNMSDSTFSEQSVFNSLQEINQVNMTQMCCPGPAPAFGDGSMQTSETTCSHPSEQQQFIQHSFVQSMPVFPEPAVGSGTATNIYSSNPSVNPPPLQTSVDQGHLQTMSSVAGNDIHFFHDGQASQYHPVSDTSLQFHLQPEYSDTASRPFQNVPESETNFQGATVLSSSFPASGNQVHYTSSQDNLGFSMMDVNTSLLPGGTVDSSNQFKAPEKMHVDEPEGLFHQHQAAINSNNNDYFHFKRPEAASTETDMQTYHSENCQQTSETSSFIPGNSFTPSIESSSNNFPAVTRETVESSNAGFESTNNLFPSSSMSSSFDSSNYLASTNEPCANVQPTHSFQSSNTDCHFPVSQDAGLNEAASPEFPMQSSPSPNNTNFVASHGNQYIEQPVNSLISPSIQQAADPITSSSEFQRMTKQSMEASQPMAGEQFQQISLSTFSSDDSLIVNPATSVSSTVPSQDTISHQQNFAATSMPSSSYINFSPADNVTMHQDLNVKATSELTITEFPNPSTASGLNHFHDDNDNDAFPNLDIQAVVSGNFTVDSSLSSIQHSSVNIDSASQSGIFGGYPFENNQQVQPSTTNCGNPSDLDFPHQDQLQMPGLSSTSFLQNSAHSSNADPQGLYHLQSDQFSSTNHEVDFKLQDYPQPMQVHDSGFTKKIPDSSSAFSFHPHRGNGSSLETAMDISSSSNERSLSYEDIHRSIVKAGNSFTANSADANSAYIPMAHADNEAAPIPSSLSQQTFSSESNAFYDIGKSMGNFHSVAETPTSLTSPSLSSTQVTFSNSTELNSLLNTSLSNNNETVLSGLFSTISSPSHNLSVINNNLRSDVIPNFLDQPAVTVTGLDSRIHIPDHLDQPMKLSECQTGFIGRDGVGTLESLPTLAPNTTLSHTNVAPNTDILTSQEQNRNSISMGQNLFQNPLLINSSLNPIAVSAQSQFGVVSTESGITGRATNISMPLTIQIPSNKLDSKATIINQELSSHLDQKPRFATIVIPTTSSVNDKSQQRNITEELQRLLAQQTLSHHSYTASQQQTPLPQTLVLQKPTSSNVQWLKQNQTHQQPKLLIKGPLFASQTRSLQPQQQLQQTREKLLIVQQTSQLPRTMDSASVENQKIPAPFQLIVTSKEQQPHVQKLQLLQPAQVLEQQPKIAFQMKQSQFQSSQNLVYQVVSSDQRRTSLPLSGQLAPSELKHPHQQPVMNTIYFTQFNAELQQLKKQQEQEKEDKTRHGADTSERSDRQCSDSIKKEYKHLHSLLTGDSTAGIQTTSHIPVLNLANNLQGTLQLANGPVFNLSTATTNPTKNVAPHTSAPFSFLPMNAALSLPPLSSSSVFVPAVSTGFSGLSTTSTASTASTTPLFHLAFPNTFTSSLKSAESKDFKSDTGTSNLLILPQQLHNGMQSAPEVIKTEGAQELASRGNTSATPVLLDRKRSHTPLSVDIHSPNSGSEAPSPLSSPVPIEDGNTQATLIERSADLQIKSDTMQGVNDDDENASFFDINSFHKRPSTEEVQSPGRIEENVPMKILKGSLNTDARSSVQPPLSPEHAFDIGSVVSTASNFSFVFGNKEDNSEIFTFGSGNAGTSTTESLKYKSGSKHSRLTSTKPTLKSQTMVRASLPTQQVRPVSRKQKEYSLKAYYPSKVENMELKILEQPESHHRARYQTEGSRGAIKDRSQQGFPVIKLVGYNKPTKLQVFIGDECGRVKPHGFYQACRVFGKNSTACTEQEIEGTTVIDVDILPENNMIVKLDCIGILKLRNADVERRIGPKRARDKKKNNTRARLVLRTTVEKSDGSFHVLQAVSNPIVCTQPVGQPEICRMSVSESTISGGDSLFIIGKNFKNKGTSVLFQKLDSNDEVVIWQAEAEIEQEFFQPTHLICKVPAFKDQLITKPEQVQIVVSCAGKKSDAQMFTYKPVYQVAQSVKHEVAMETDAAASSKPLPFVSPEALHLNKMVQESSTSSSLFQLPPGTLPTLQGSPDLKPSRFLGSGHFQEAAKVSPLASAGAMSSGMPGTDAPEAGVQTFLLDSDGPASGSESRSQWTSPSDDTAQVSVHKNSDIYSAGSSSYSMSRDSPMILSANSGQNKNVPSACLESALSSKPIVVVLDTGNLQSDSGTKIQQLLQQILEAQTKK